MPQAAGTCRSAAKSSALWRELDITAVTRLRGSAVTASNMYWRAIVLTPTKPHPSNRLIAGSLPPSVWVSPAGPGTANRSSATARGGLGKVHRRARGAPGAAGMAGGISPDPRAISRVAIMCV